EGFSPVYFGLWGAGLAGLLYASRKIPVPTWIRALGAAVVVGALAVALFLPFYLSFRPPVVSEGGGLPLRPLLREFTAHPIQTLATVAHSIPLGLVPYRSLMSQFLQFWGVQ